MPPEDSNNRMIFGVFRNKGAVGQVEKLSAVAYNDCGRALITTDSQIEAMFKGEETIVSGLEV